MIMEHDMRPAAGCDMMADELDDRIRDVLTDNCGKPEGSGMPSAEEVACDVSRINPDPGTLDRG